MPIGLRNVIMKVIEGRVYAFGGMDVGNVGNEDVFVLRRDKSGWEISPGVLPDGVDFGAVLVYNNNDKG